MFPTWSDWQLTYTTKGLAKRRTKRALRYLGVCGLIGAIIFFRRNLQDSNGYKIGTIGWRGS